MHPHQGADLRRRRPTQPKIEPLRYTTEHVRPRMSRQRAATSRQPWGRPGKADARDLRLQAGMSRSPHGVRQTFVVVEARPCPLLCVAERTWTDERRSGVASSVFSHRRPMWRVVRAGKSAWRERTGKHTAELSVGRFTVAAFERERACHALTGYSPRTCMAISPNDEIWNRLAP